MHIRSLQLKNIGPFESFEVKPKALTVIRGRNGAGKTTIVNSVRYLGEKAHDPTLIRNGAEFGEIRLVIADPGNEYDGANFVCTITSDKTTRVLHHPKLGKIPVAQSKKWLEDVVNMVSLDPARFLTATDKEQTAIFLQAQPLRITADQIGFIPVEFLKDADLDKHALEVLGDKDTGVYGALYSARAAVKKEGDIKAKYALQLRSTLPADAPEGDWSDLLKQATTEKHELYKATAGKVADLKSTAAKALDAAGKEYLEQRATVDKECDDTADRIKDELQDEIHRLEHEATERIAKLQADCSIEIDRLAEARDQKTGEAIKLRDESITREQEAYAPKNEELTHKIARAQAMVEQHAKSKATIDMAEQAESGKVAADSKEREYTAMLKKLEALKSELLKNTPIPGLEIVRGSLVLDGVPLKRVNDAKKAIKVMLAITRLQAGPLGFAVLDNFEKLDEEQWPTFEAIAREMGMQVLATVATARDKDGNKIDGPLQIETEGAA